jgi:16S rRNA (cytidine1402-2'-O)-methyltransferase
MKQGKLFVVATPIGNMEDITLRAIKTLETVDMIAAEDTRHTVKLLNRFEIKKPLISFHEHSVMGRQNELLDALAQGQDIALVSDAGTPLISDPGSGLVAAAVAGGFDVVPIPGASAVIAGLSVSGLLKDAFVFEGILPTKNKERDAVLLRIKDETRCVVLYEAPHRIEKTLEVLKNTFGGQRQMVLAREMTKVYEEFIRGSIDDVLSEIKQRTLKGEMVLILEGAEDTPREVSDAEIESELKRMLAEGKTKKDAINMTASSFAILKNRVYKIALKL